MKNNSFEKTERAKHRKKQMKNTKIPKLIFIKNQDSVVMDDWR